MGFVSTPRVVLAVAVFVVLLVAYWGLLFVAQRWVMFPGAAFEYAEHPPQSDTLRVVHTGPDGTWEVWHLLPSEPNAPTIIYAHGNGELIDLWLQPFEDARRAGYGVLLVEYPGYGRSGGSASKQSVEQAMLAAYDYAVQQPEVDASRIIGYGRSLGGAAVAAASLRRPFAALIIQSSFSSTATLARPYGLWGPLIRDPFDSAAALRAFDGPVLLLHGQHDRIIPQKHSEDLQRASPRAELELLPCGHNNCVHPWRNVVAFLKKHELSPGSQGRTR